MIEELKPCPICGKTPKRVVDNGEFGGDFRYKIVCCCNVFDNESSIKIMDKDLQKCVQRWNALPRQLHWTKIPPTKPGCYWNRKPDELRGSVVEVFEWGGKLHVFYP